MTPVGVAGERWHDDLQARHVGEPGFVALGMPPVGAVADSGAQDERNAGLTGRHVVDVRGLKDDLAHRNGQELAKEISTIGRWPRIAAPTAAPTIADSLIGASQIRRGPNSS